VSARWWLYRRSVTDSAPTNGHRFTARGLPWRSPVQVYQPLWFRNHCHPSNGSLRLNVSRDPNPSTFICVKFELYVFVEATRFYWTFSNWHSCTRQIHWYSLGVTAITVRHSLPLASFACVPHCRACSGEERMSLWSSYIKRELVPLQTVNNICAIQTIVLNASFAKSNNVFNGWIQSSETAGLY